MAIVLCFGFTEGEEVSYGNESGKTQFHNHEDREKQREGDDRYQYVPSEGTKLPASNTRLDSPERLLSEYEKENEAHDRDESESSHNKGNDLLTVNGGNGIGNGHVHELRREDLT